MKFLHSPPIVAVTLTLPYNLSSNPICFCSPTKGMWLRSVFVCLVVAVMLAVLYTLSARPNFNIQGKTRYPLAALPRELFCENILANITDGNWIRKLDLLKDISTAEYKKLSRDEEFLDKELSEYRIEQGFHTCLWRDDLKCGFDNFQKKPVHRQAGPPVGAWCDAKMETPCCSDEKNGTCGKECECPRCVDMRKIYHAAISEWTLSDGRCKWRNYTAEEACEVISRFSEVQFIGDSLVRKMSRGLALLLRSDPNFGGMPKTLIGKPDKTCTGESQYYWGKCVLPSGNFRSILADQRPLCGMSLERFSMYYYGGSNGPQEYLETVRRLVGKPGTVVVVGFGLWRDCNYQIISKQYMDPVVRFLENFYQNRTLNDGMRWPLMIFVPPNTSGLMKPKQYRPRNGNVPCKKFAEKMKTYCDNHNISVLDVRKLTYGVHSFDGTHHGLAINIMKNQLMLNYLDSVSVGKNWSVSA